LLVLNTDLPIFPGGGGVEFLAMTRLAARLQAIGVVSIAHSNEQRERSQDLVTSGVRLYLETPWLDNTPQAVAYWPGWIRRVHRWFRDAVEIWQAGERPFDTRLMDAAFANMAPALTKALAPCSTRGAQATAVFRATITLVSPS
jgi:hypothetical protein